MKKIVPDPPLPNTTQRSFSRCDAGHPPLFTVNPGVSAHDALVHVAQYLRGAYDCGYKALEHPQKMPRRKARTPGWTNNYPTSEHLHVSYVSWLSKN
ncbi:DUF3077 domain-containing protein [Pseudomonas sp. JR33AA]|uniref:DUF3077 domain-containing protein n=1 Tax=Pseudomonas sp. JR33AA TaxID=2899113 RepID=UPI001F40DEF1|nr:DUF3077 domain-containing protein [Pseudomonas sp. JR33AA]MCE5975804.1 DUF3077 domain-containing protein [Pseudomonas sp. JR33AA]